MEAQNTNLDSKSGNRRADRSVNDKASEGNDNWTCKTKGSKEPHDG